MSLRPRLKRLERRAGADVPAACCCPVRITEMTQAEADARDAAGASPGGPWACWRCGRPTAWVSEVIVIRPDGPVGPGA
jgi:hypothetical protein